MNKAEREAANRDRQQGITERDRQIRKANDPLEQLARADPKRVIALMLWKARRRNPDLYEKIDARDLEGFEACVSYLKVQPDVMIKRPQGVPAQDAIPAAGNRRAVPAREATPPKPYVIVALVEKGTENAVRPVEDNQEDFDAAAQAQRIRRARDQGPTLAERLLQQGRTGEYSLSDIQDAANALLLLATAEPQ